MHAQGLHKMKEFILLKMQPFQVDSCSQTEGLDGFHSHVLKVLGCCDGQTAVLQQLLGCSHIGACVYVCVRQYPQVYGCNRISEKWTLQDKP